MLRSGCCEAPGTQRCRRSDACARYRSGSPDTFADPLRARSGAAGPIMPIAHDASAVPGPVVAGVCDRVGVDGHSPASRDFRSFPHDPVAHRG
jgi:hypothetical protein